MVSFRSPAHQCGSRSQRRQASVCFDTPIPTEKEEKYESRTRRPSSSLSRSPTQRYAYLAGILLSALPIRSPDSHTLGRHIWPGILLSLLLVQYRRLLLSSVSALTTSARQAQVLADDLSPNHVSSRTFVSQGEISVTLVHLPHTSPSSPASGFLIKPQTHLVPPHSPSPRLSRRQIPSYRLAPSRFALPVRLSGLCPRPPILVVERGRRLRRRLRGRACKLMSFFPYSTLAALLSDPSRRGVYQSRLGCVCAVLHIQRSRASALLCCLAFPGCPSHGNVSSDCWRELQRRVDQRQAFGPRHGPPRSLMADCVVM